MNITDNYKNVNKEDISNNNEHKYIQYSVFMIILDKGKYNQVMDKNYDINHTFSSIHVD